MVDWITAIVGLVGVALGGGLQAAHTAFERRLEAKSVLSALVAEVESLKRLIHHRGFIRQFVLVANECRNLSSQGRGAEMYPTFTISVSEDYFSLFNALSPKIGLLDRYQADRIVRFYVLVKAAKENFTSDAPWTKKPVTVNAMLQIIESDIEILRVAYLLGDEIAGFVDRTPKDPLARERLVASSTPPPDPLALELDDREVQGATVQNV